MRAVEMKNKGVRISRSIKKGNIHMALETERWASGTRKKEEEEEAEGPKAGERKSAG